MRPRVFLGRCFIRAGRFIQSLALMVMRPDDLVEFSRRTYAKSRSVEGWGREDIADAGLPPSEKSLLEELPSKGRLLLLGVGGGREAIPLARMGFEVTGVDFVPEMVEKAKANAAQRGLKIEGLAQEISQLDVPPRSFDVVWLSAAMYSCVPTKKRRVEMLRKISKALKPGGYFACQFNWDNRRSEPSPTGELVRKAFALLTLGNLWYEKGDMLWGNVEFAHVFSSEDELRAEFEEAEFEIVYFHVTERMMRGEAVLRKAPLG